MADPAQYGDRSPRPVDPPPVFETPRLRLRPWRDSDSPGPGEGPDEASVRFMPDGAQPRPDDFPAWLARRRGNMETGADVYWCVADRATDEMLGNVQVFGMEPANIRFQGELGYWLRPGSRGHGFIGEALAPVVAHAFRPVEDGGLGLTRLHAATTSDNDVSASILRSAGFRQWGADHQAWRRADGSLSDSLYFELLASELVAAGREAGTHPHRARAGGWEPVTLASDPLHTGGVPRIRLREWRHTDTERVVEACSDQRTRHWLAANLPSPYTLEHAHSYIAGCIDGAQAGSSLCWCVADPESDLCVGSVAVMALRDAHGTAGEIGYWTHPEARGRGVMSEAVLMAVRHAFISREDGGLGRKRLRLNAATGNLASLHIARANGFVPIGRDRQSEPLGDGTFADLLRFDLLVDEWERSLSF